MFPSTGTVSIKIMSLAGFKTIKIICKFGGVQNNKDKCKFGGGQTIKII